MDVQWKSYRRFTFWLLIVCAAIVALVSALALWKAYTLAEFGGALAIAGVVVTFLGLLPFLMLLGSFQRSGMWGSGAATVSNQRVLMAVEEAEMLGPNEMIRQDMKDKETGMPLTALLLTAGVLCMLAGWGLQALG